MLLMKTLSVFSNFNWFGRRAIVFFLKRNDSGLGESKSADLLSGFLLVRNAGY